jgi:hypothetical protein
MSVRLCKDCGQPGIKGNPLGRNELHVDWVQCMNTLKARCAALEQEAQEHRHSFEIRWKADMRAIERWQKEKPGRDLMWPDHTDLLVWLMHELHQAERPVFDEGFDDE